MWKLYRISQVQKVKSIGVYHFDTSEYTEIIELGLKTGKIGLYRDAFEPSHYIESQQATGIEIYCAPLNLFFRIISKSRLQKIYNEIISSECKSTSQQLKLIN